MINYLFCWIHSPTIVVDIPSFISCILFLPLSYSVNHSLHGYYRPHFHNLNTWSLSSLHLYLHLLLPIDIWYSHLTPLPSPSYTGTLPPAWSAMTSMTDLWLYSNQLSGKWSRDGYLTSCTRIISPYLLSIIHIHDHTYTHTHAWHECMI